MSKIIKKIGSLGKVSAKYINDNGIVAFNEKVLEKIDEKLDEHNYNKKFKTRAYIEKKMDFKYEPLISIVVPTYNTPIKFLEEMIDSVKVQRYENWELCIADASTLDETRNALEKIIKTDNRIRVVFLNENKGISGNTNEALKMAVGEYIGLLDHDDLLTEDALYEIIAAINDNDYPDFIYTDEDKIDESGSRIFMPHFKPDFSPDLLYSCNYITHFSVFSKRLLSKNSSFNEKYDGSQDYDLILRLTNNANKVVHVPKVLYHWRCHMNSVALNPSSKDYAYVSARRALEDFNFSRGYKCRVESMKNMGHYKINFHIKGNPKVNIIIRNINAVSKLDECLQHLYYNTNYNNRLINVVVDKSFKNKLNEINELYENKINIVFTDDKSETAVINELIESSKNIKYTILLDSRVRIKDKDWVEQMLMYCQRSNVGIVGGKIYYKNKKVKHAGLILDSDKIVKPIYHGSASNYGGYFLRTKLVQNLSVVSWECIMIKTDNNIKTLDEKYRIPLAIINHCMQVNMRQEYVVFNPFVEGIYDKNYSRRGYQIEKLDTKENIEEFKKKWCNQLKNDPYFNKNLMIKGKQIKINMKGGKCS